MPDGPNKEMNGQWQGRSNDRQGWQAERINRSRSLGKERRRNKRKRTRRGGHQRSHPTTPQAMEKKVKEGIRK